MEFHNTSSFPKRRSYPNLRHISLAPLTPRFPIDDDIDQADYFNYQADETSSASGNRTPTRSSYLSSVSVPSTPPILSHSRSTSRTRHHTRSKSSTRAAPASDTNLLNHHVPFPLHHTGPKKRSSASATTHSTTKSDAEWMLRAGIALASSTREEKGQSWLSKRESSTSLVSEMPTEDNNAPHHRHHHRTKSGASSRKSRSGASTPAWSRANSRRGSRVGLTMTSLPPLSSASSTGKAPSPSATGAMTPEARGRSSESGTGLVPDFVDEKIRAEMASLQDQDRELVDEDWDKEESESEYDYFSDETQEEFDEADLQRLTRERGFGLGGWIDRLVEWTLFGVDELPVVSASAGNRIGATATTTTVTFEEPENARGDLGGEGHDSLSLHSEGDRHSLSDDADSICYTDGESNAGVEKPGRQGGWEDASWLFRVVKQALV